MNEAAGRLESINTSRGGVPKISAFEALITEHGVDGDRQRDVSSHGGLDRAVVLYSLDVIRALQQEGHPIAAGSTGENLTVSGVEWATIEPGVELSIGDVRLRVTTYAAPCRNIGPYFLNDDYSRISQKRNPGWSRVCARVLVGGIVRIGDAIAIVNALSTQAAHPVEKERA